MLKLILALLGGSSKKRRKFNVVPRGQQSYRSQSAQWNQAQQRRQTPLPEAELTRSTGKGRMTGYEPNKLRGYNAPISINAKGNAGFGLFQSGFSGQNVYNGQQGEVGFYKALCMAELVDESTSYWSVAMPADGRRAVPDTKFETDVDCIVVQGNKMYLIDLKYFASGDVTWHSTDGEYLLCRDNKTGKQVGKPRKMTRNMAIAQERFPKLFPKHRIESYVVLIPTNDGIGQVQQGTAWPGNILLITLPDMLEKIRRGGRGFADAATDAALSGLIKD